MSLTCLRPGARFAAAAFTLITLARAAPVSAEDAPSVPVTQPPSPPPPSPGLDGQLVAGWAVGGVGLGGLAISGLMGGLALMKKGEMEDDGCRRSASGLGICNSTAGQEAAYDAQSFGLVSTIALGAGLAGVAAGTILLVTAPRASSRPRATAGVRVRADLLAIGRDGAFFGIRGTW